MSSYRDRLAAQAADDQVQQQLQAARPNLPPDRPRARRVTLGRDA